MTYRLVIKPLAAIDLQECYDWYEGKQTGLGDKFLSRFEKDLESLHLNPHHYQVRYRNVIRMKRVYRFPVCVHFTVEKETIFIHAVLPTHRDPKNWGGTKL